VMFPHLQRCQLLALSGSVICGAAAALPLCFDNLSRRFDKLSRRFDKLSRRFDKRLRRFDKRPRRFDHRPRRFDHRPRRFDNRPCRFDQRSRRFGYLPRRFDQRSRRFDHRFRRFRSAVAQVRSAVPPVRSPETVEVVEHLGLTPYVKNREHAHAATKSGGAEIEQRLPSRAEQDGVNDLGRIQSQNTDDLGDSEGDVEEQGQQAFLVLPRRVLFTL
jgi:hypothetical protein